MNSDKYESLRGFEWQYQNYVDQTVLNPVAFCFVILMGFLLLSLSRRYAVIPLIAVALFITSVQKIVIGNADLHMLRVILLFGIVRVILKSEYREIKLNVIDKIMIWYSLVPIVAGYLLWGTFRIFMNRAGFAFTALGTYFVCRMLIRDTEDVGCTIKALVILSIPIMLFMINEQITRQNFFSIMGGVHEITPERSGKLRSQGSFSHPIMAGSLGASLIPLTLGYWYLNRKSIKFLLIGLITGTIITFTSNSSGPYLSYFAAIFGLSLWFLRAHMRSIFWGGVGILALLHFVIMKGPVWHLIGLASVVSGSTASFRVRLINAWINRFSEWWLFGTYGSGHWGWGLEDVTNWYVRHSINGGLLHLILFIVIISLCFKTVGRTIRKTENRPDLQRFIWALGACLFAHTIAFIGVSYFGQMRYIWFLMLAMISTFRDTDVLNNLKSLEK